MAHHSQAITSLPRSAVDDRHRRMVRYSVTMGIRLVCVLLCVVVRDWWILLFATGAVFLPYVAVVLANVVDSRSSAAERPGPLELSDTVIVADTATKASSPHDEK